MLMALVVLFLTPLTVYVAAMDPLGDNDSLEYGYYGVVILIVLLAAIMS